MLMMMLALVLQQATPSPAPAPAPGAILLDRNRVDRAATLARSPAPAPARPSATVAATGRGVPISGIRFTGAKAPAPVARRAAAFLGRPATRETLGRLAAALSAAYGKSAVALYTVAIPQQSLAGGVVVVSLTEGRIARATLAAQDHRRHPLLARRMAPLTREAPLSRATFERQFTLMRAIPGLTFDTQLADPQHDGALALTVTPRQRRSKVTAGFTNRGVDLLGGGQLDLRGDLYGLGVDGDDLTLTASSSSDFKRFRTVSAGYAAPVTASGLTAGASIAYLETRPTYTGIAGHPVLGTAAHAGVSLSYPLIRGFATSADLSLAVDGLNSDAAAFGNVLAREHTRAARVAASYATSSAKRSVSASASLSQGLAVAGARAEPLSADTGFAKAVASVSATQAIGRRLALRVSASGQYANDRLPAAERFALGGAAIGRAFDTAVLTGDRGGGGSAELAWMPLKRAALATSELYGFVDAGSVRVLARGPVPARDYSLASAGAGLRARYRAKAELGLEAAHVIRRPYPGITDDWRLIVAWRLSV